MPSIPARRLLRQRLYAERERFAAEAAFDAAHAALGAHLVDVLRQLEPQCLGMYWAIRFEFNPVPALCADAVCQLLPWALPYTQRQPPQMHYRHWDGAPPPLRDECGIPVPPAVPAQPDVVLVPCVGFTRGGLRLGYGGGYFDRWLQAHPHATAIGLAWSFCEVEAAAFQAEAHDLPMTLILTEQGVVG